MSAGRHSGMWHDPCYAQCPPSTVTIRPPPFVLTIPGPSLCCPDQSFCIEQYNPCAYSYRGSRSSLYASGGSNMSSFYNQALPSNTCSSGSCWL